MRTVDNSSCQLAGAPKAWLVVATALALCLDGCSGLPVAVRVKSHFSSHAQGPTFPTVNQLTKLAATPPPAKIEAHGIEVASWPLTGPFPDSMDVVPTSVPAPWAALVPAAPGGGAAALAVTQDMSCVARELGHFYLTHAQLPTETLHRYILGWCGATAVDSDVHFLSGDVPAKVNDAHIFAAWKDQAATLLASFAGKDRLVGVWFGREGGHAVLAVTSSVPRARLEPLPLAPDVEGNVVIRGSVLVPGRRLRALVNRGRLGVVECVLDEHVPLPAFAAHCVVDGNDTSAWIELSAFAPGRVLGVPVLRVLARRPEAQAVYAIGTAAQGPTAAGDASTVTLLGLVNEARAAASLPALAPASEDVELATQLAPFFFTEWIDGGLGDNSDLIALGLMAGWNVDARVNDASLYAAWVRSDDPHQLIAACLDSPGGRWVLMDPRATHLVVGGLQERDASASLTAGLFVTYETIVGADPSAAASSVFERVTEARVGRNLPRPTPIAGMEKDVAHVVAELRKGSMTLEDAGDYLLTQGVRTTGMSLRAEIVDTPDLARLDLPDEVFAKGKRSMLVVVAPYRPSGQPWWRWAIFIVSGDPGRRELSLDSE